MNHGTIPNHPGTSAPLCAAASPHVLATSSVPHNVPRPNSRHISAAIASPNFNRPDKDLGIPPSASSTATGASPGTCRRRRTGSLAAAPAAGAAAALRYRTLRGANAWMGRRHMKKSGIDRERRSAARLLMIGGVCRVPIECSVSGLSGSGGSRLDRAELWAGGPLFRPPASALMSAIPAIPRRRRGKPPSARVTARHNWKSRNTPTACPEVRRSRTHRPPS